MCFLTAFSTANLLIGPYAFAMSAWHQNFVRVVSEEFSDCIDHRLCSVPNPERACKVWGQTANVGQDHCAVRVIECRAAIDLGHCRVALCLDRRLGVSRQ